MLSNLTGWHFIIILFVVLLLFGAPKLPALARSLGQSAKILKTEMAPSNTDPTSKPAPGQVTTTAEKPAAGSAPTGSAATISAPTVAAPAPYVPGAVTPPVSAADDRTV
jgi:sec-independent protein translocase protein TatA